MGRAQARAPLWAWARARAPPIPLFPPLFPPGVMGQARPWFALVCIGLNWFALVLHWFCIGFALVCIGFVLGLH